MSSKTRIQLEAWLKTISVDGGRVLDVGGSQLPVNKRLASFKADEYKILDLENPHQGEKPDIVFDLNEPADFPKCKDGTFREGGSFDKVFCLEVSEYWWNSIAALTNINYLMKVGAELYISFHFVYPVHNPTKFDYMRYTPMGVRRILGKTGFEIIDNIARTADSNKYMEFCREEGMRPSKDYASHKVMGNLIKAKKL